MTRALARHWFLLALGAGLVVAVTWPATARRPKIEHYLNAFPANGGSMFG